LFYNSTGFVAQFKTRRVVTENRTIAYAEMEIMNGLHICALAANWCKDVGITV
jgi:hypothetical protein